MKLVVTMILSTVVAAGVFLGCGKEEEETEESELEGTWASAECVDDGDGEYSIATYIFKEDAATVSQTGYSDAECTTKTMSLVLTGTFKTGEDASSATSVSGATSIDISVKTAKLTLHSADLVAGVNDENGCTSDVTIDTAVDLSECESLFDGDDIPGVGDVMKSIYKVSGSTLTMGSEESKDSNGREDSLEVDKPLTKQ